MRCRKQGKEDEPLSHVESVLRVLSTLLPLNVFGGWVLRRAVGLDVVSALIGGLPLGVSFALLGVLGADAVGLGLFPAAYVLSVLLGVAVVLAAPSGRRADRAGSGPWATLGATLAAAAFLWVLFVPRMLPYGWDPTFHLLLAEKSLLSNALPGDWKPFERIAVNMPVALHGLMALQARLTSVPVTVVFNVDLALLVAWSAGLVGLWAEELKGGSGWLAAAIYAFGTTWGSLDYGRWGGITNAAGMLLLLTSLLLIVRVAESGRPKGAVFPALALGAVAATHHHSFLVAGLVLIPLLVFLVRTGRLPTRFAVSLLALSAVAGAPALVRYVRGAGSLAMTRVFSFEEELDLLTAFPDLLLTLGFVPVLGTLGWLASRRLREGWKATVVLLWLGTLAAAFFVCRGLWMLVSYATAGRMTTILSPLRFWTDLAYPAAAVAGVFVSERLGRAGSWRPVGTTLVAGALVWQCWWGMSQQANVVTFNGPFLEVARWARTRVPEDALIVTEDAWVSFLAWRETTVTPLPASEATLDPGVVFKRTVLCGDVDELRQWAISKGRPVYVLAYQELGGKTFRLRYRSDGCFLYEFIPFDG